MAQIGNSQSEVVKGLDMAIASKQDFEELKASCNSKAKAYVSIVWVKDKLDQSQLEKLNAVRNLQIN